MFPGVSTLALDCTSCGRELDPRRVELGYDYCTAPDCQQRHVAPLRMARVGVNKAADQFVRAETLLPAAVAPSAAPVIHDDEDDPDEATTPPPRHPARPQPRRLTAAERMRAAEAALDARLERSYRRFCAGEISATEMDRERNALVDAFNAKLLTQGVRYRHLLRRRF